MTWPKDSCLSSGSRGWAVTVLVRWRYLIFDEVSRIFQVHLLSPQWVVMSGQSQAPQRVTATAPLPNDRHNLLFDTRSHGDLSTSNSDVGAPVDDPFRSALRRGDSGQQLHLPAYLLRELSLRSTCLHKHLAHGCAARFIWCTIDGH